MAIGTYAELQTAVGNWLGDPNLTSRIPEFISLAEDDFHMKLRVRAMERTADLIMKATQAGGTAGGTANALTVTVSAISSLTIGDTVSFVAASNNTSTVTLNVSGTGATALNKADGTVGLDADDLIAGQTYYAYYDGTRWRLVPYGGIPLPTRFLGMRRMYLDVNPTEDLRYFPADDLYSRGIASETGKPIAYTIEGDFMVFRPVPDSAYVAKLMFYQGFARLSANGDTNWLLSNARAVYLYGTLVQAAPYVGDDQRSLTWASLYDDALEALTKSDKRDRFPVGLRARSDVAKR